MAGDPDALPVLVSGSPEATEDLGRRLGELLRAGDVVALNGELGSGKTTFVRGLARGLGIQGEATSPSFTLMQEYEGRVPLYHFDAWMAGREALFLEGGGVEYLGGDGVAVVEWAERIAVYLPRPHLALHLAHRTQETREIRLSIEPSIEEGESETGEPGAEERLRDMARELVRSS